MLYYWHDNITRLTRTPRPHRTAAEVRHEQDVIITVPSPATTPRSREAALRSHPRADRHYGYRAAQAGAAIVHIHVRNPETGAFSMETKYYREV